MRYYRIFIVIALCVSLFINFNLLFKLDSMENRVNSISSNQNQMMSSVNSQTANIRNIINDIKREQSWLGPIYTATKITDVEQGAAVVNFEWQIKELRDNSKVVFNYKNGDEKEYTSIDAVKKGSGLFETTVPIKIDFEPEWRVIINESDDDKGERAVREREIEEGKKDSRLKGIKYFVTVTHNDTMKSSDINETHFGNLGVSCYGYLEAFTNINKYNKYSISVIGNSFHDKDSAVLKNAYLKIYNNGQLLDQEKLVSQDINEEGRPTRENASVFYNEPSDKKLDYDSIILKAVYSDGAVFEKEIYSR